MIGWLIIGLSGFMSTSLVQHFGTSAGELPMASRNTDLEGLDAGKYSLGLSIWVFV